MNNRQIGAYCEDYIANFLNNNSYDILERNFRYGRNAEIDIIALKDSKLHIIEVKGRSADTYGLPCESVNKSKISKILKATQYYISISHSYNIDINFDIAEVYFSKYDSCDDKIEITSINILKNAF